MRKVVVLIGDFVDEPNWGVAGVALTEALMDHTSGPNAFLSVDADDPNLAGPIAAKLVMNILDVQNKLGWLDE